MNGGPMPQRVVFLVIGLAELVNLGVILALVIIVIGLTSCCGASAGQDKRLRIEKQVGSGGEIGGQRV